MADRSRGLLRIAEAERHEVIQGLTFMCQNARGQGGELEEEKEGQSEWEARGGARKARGAERQWRSCFVSILDNCLNRIIFNIKIGGWRRRRVEE